MSPGPAGPAAVRLARCGVAEFDNSAVSRTLDSPSVALGDTRAAPQRERADDDHGHRRPCGSAALLTACGRDNTGGATDETRWNFTDDRGARVNLPARPTRIATYETAGAALINLGVRPVASFGSYPVNQTNPSLAGLDLTGVESVGQVYDEVNVEKLAAPDVELVVTVYDSREEDYLFSLGKDGTLKAQVEAIAPIVALDFSPDPLVVIKRFEELAAALGADLQTPELQAVRQDYQDAGNELRAAVNDKPGLLAVALSASPTNGIYIYPPTSYPGLRQLQSLGLQLVDPDGNPSAGDPDYFYEQLSLEQVGKYPADLFLFDSFTSLEDMAAVSIWAAQPAVKAGQLAPFRLLETWSYRAYASDFRAVTTAVRAANPDLY